MPSAIITITPEQAADLLANMVPSRRVNTGQVDRYLQEMQARTWQPEGQDRTVITMPDGRLVKGQHVLHAIVRYGNPVPVRAAQGAYCTNSAHSHGQHDVSCMPPADPANPELRLIRAIYGLCPDCDQAEPHAHPSPYGNASLPWPP